MQGAGSYVPDVLNGSMKIVEESVHGFHSDLLNIKAPPRALNPTVSVIFHKWGGAGWSTVRFHRAQYIIASSTKPNSHILYFAGIGLLTNHPKKARNHDASRAM